MMNGHSFAYLLKQTLDKFFKKRVLFEVKKFKKVTRKRFTLKRLKYVV